MPIIQSRFIIYHPRASCTGICSIPIPTLFMHHGEDMQSRNMQSALCSQNNQHSKRRQYGLFVHIAWSRWDWKPWGSAQFGLFSPTDQQTFDWLYWKPPVRVPRSRSHIKSVPASNQHLSCSDGAHSIIHLPSFPHWRKLTNPNFFRKSRGRRKATVMQRLPSHPRLPVKSTRRTVSALPSTSSNFSCRLTVLALVFVCTTCQPVKPMKKHGFCSATSPTLWSYLFSRSNAMLLS